jgi:hypothetical protein
VIGAESVNLKTLERSSFKISVLKEQLLKNAGLQPLGRKTARAFAKLTEFCKKLI